MFFCRKMPLLSSVCMCALLCASYLVAPSNANPPTPTPSLPPPTVEEYCEDAHVCLNCPANSQSINIIRADYGRSDSTVCESEVEEENQNTTCSSEEAATAKVRRICQNKQICNFEADNELVGDPCQGTMKYLEVEWECGALICH